MMPVHLQPATVFASRAIELKSRLLEESRSLGELAEDLRSYSPFLNALRSEFERLLDEIDTMLELFNREGAPLAHARCEQIRAKASNLFSESLSLRLVSAIRNKLDIGMCEIADVMLAELAAAVVFQLPHLSTVADSEYYGVSSRVIRLRYPSKSIWDLPILAHEFGHCFGPSWTVEGSADAHPRDTFIRSGKLGTRTVNDEYFCDLLATYLLGPAYVYTCLVERFTPLGSQGSDTHPSDSKRALWVLEGLELLADMADPDDRSDYRRRASELRTFWSSYGQSPGTEQVPDEELQLLKLSAAELFSKFRRALPLASYNKPAKAWGLLADRTEHGSSNGNKAITLRDVLNAAWFARIEQGTSSEVTDQIGHWALLIARGVVRERN